MATDVHGDPATLPEPVAESFGRGASALWGIYDDIGVFQTLSRPLTSLPRTIAPGRSARRALDRSGSAGSRPASSPLHARSGLGSSPTPGGLASRWPPSRETVAHRSRGRRPLPRTTSPGR